MIAQETSYICPHWHQDTPPNDPLPVNTCLVVSLSCHGITFLGKSGPSAASPRNACVVGTTSHCSILCCHMDCSHIQPSFGIHPPAVSLPTNDRIRYHPSHSHYDPAAQSGDKREGEFYPLVGSTNILVNVMCHNGLDSSLTPFEELVESVAVVFMLHTKFVFTICSNVDF